ncbi:hypothetical protein [Myxococcus sp. RHSTA-1-4]|uniref:hypothetical protein n=1 Tax=Myxococcus sp. RHSTA-1-4 TaxID=2874601 RepID=UPI001CBF1689|nr:hypothetical protein [Myxococcus sp. RHSTA-1-4]MBZ4420669.1 hypothetical protein [Myxococcus sp. RHSTA-1-4]
MALAALLPLLGLDGWPFNHEGFSVFERAEAFRRAYAAGDFFPLWTPFCHNGHGSPWPFFYHRLFTTLSGGLAWVLGSAFRGVQLALLLGLLAGALGMAAVARRLGASPRLQVLAAFLLCFSPYAYLDWLVRGAAAELSAMMLYPWLLWACLRLRDEGRGGWSVGLALAAMFYAHMVMFLYAFFTLAVALGFMRARWGWRSTLAATGQAALVVLVLCAPYALLMVRLEKHFNPGALGAWTPDREYVPLARYLWDRKFHWGKQWEGITPEIGRALSIGLLVLGGVRLASRGDTRSRGPAWGLLLGSAAIYAVLQLPVSAPFYRAVPFARLLQFPWRLVAFLTPLLVLVLCMLVEDTAARDGWKRRLSWAVVGLTVFTGLWFGWRATHPRYPVASRSEIESELAALDRPWSGNEYLPRAAVEAGVPPPAAFLSHEGCEKVEAEPREALLGALHFGRITLSVSAPRGCTVRFNQFQTPFLAAEADTPARFVTTEAGTLEVQLPAGEHRVILRRRGLFELLSRHLRPGA